jgi:ferrochelatase
MTVQPKIAVLISNLGTPESPDVSSVRKYLAEFLSDPYVVDYPRIMWLPILYGIVLPFRAVKSAKLYQKVWTEEGLPLKINFAQLTLKLKEYFTTHHVNMTIFSAMRYGEPSIQSVLEKIHQENFDKVLVFPLYPQYSMTTTASTINKVEEILNKIHYKPTLKVIEHYYNHPDYISAISNSLKEAIDKKHPDKIVFSFHGLPEKIIANKDPYLEHCKATVNSVVENLQLTQDKYCLSFQSRFGKAEWIKPYTDKTLIDLAKNKFKKICVICPGFSVDCLETLEEINIQNRQLFLQAGGEDYYYIPCLNTQDIHIQMLANIILKQTEEWM